MADLFWTIESKIDKRPVACSQTLTRSVFLGLPEPIRFPLRIIDEKQPLDMSESQ